MIAPFTSSYLVCLLLAITLSSGCPPSCMCKWRNGKQTVECVGKSLLIIPQGMDTATQVVDISGNNFQYIQEDIFLKMGLVNLQKLFVSRCEIKSIRDVAFKGLTNLVELDLSENMLETVPTEALLNCPSLMKLSLSKNPITSLDRLAFNHLSFLMTLDLSGCEIIEVHEAAFSSLYSLEWIDIAHNKLRSFPDMRLFPKSLKGVQLQENQWACDCNIREFSQSLKNDIVPILIPPKCHEPRRLRGLSVRDLNETELACTPELGPTSFYFELEEGKNISLLCQVKSVPPAKVYWIFKGQVLQNNSEPTPGLHLVYFIKEEAEEKEITLFIYNLNSENNGTFYCVAENSAGVTSANYTIMVILKEAPVRLDETSDFPIDLISILLAVGLVLISLFFVALLMALIKHNTKSKNRKQQDKIKENILIPPTAKNFVQKKSILKKSTDNHKNIYITGEENTKILNQGSYKITEQNPDIINEINSDQNSSSGILLHRNGSPSIVGSRILSHNAFLPGSILVLPEKTDHHPNNLNPGTKTLRSINQLRTQPYLKPTLTSSFRPVSAPTFERYIENHDLRYTANGYPVQHDLEHNRRPMLHQTSYSENSSPKRTSSTSME